MSDVSVGSAPSGRKRRPSGEPPPLPRPLNRVVIGWVGAFVCFAVLWVWVFLSDDPAIWITRRDLDLMRPVVEHRTSWLDSVMGAINEFGTAWATPIVGWATLVGALITKRIRHAVVLLASLSVTAAVMATTATQIAWVNGSERTEATSPATMPGSEVLELSKSSISRTRASSNASADARRSGVRSRPS